MEANTTRLGAHIPMIYHFAMLQDPARMEGFKDAIHQVVRPGDKVLELGGGTGVLSFYAAQKASKVYCVEKIPENAKCAKEFLSKNNNGDRVEVICADAFDYLPPEPVDVVICEMIHVGMIREQQLEVIDSFKKRYRAKFGDKLPKFIPEAFIQGIQPINYNFNFFGYHAPVPLFQIPGQNASVAKELAEPTVFQTMLYDHNYPLNVSWSGVLEMKDEGVFNALRFILKNVLAIVPQESRGIYWHNQYLVLPLRSPHSVKKGDKLSIGFSYQSGCELEEAIASLQVRNISAPAISPLRAQIEKISCNSTDEQTKIWNNFDKDQVNRDSNNK
jgi:protein arginine N-methyltransferase 1